MPASEANPRISNFLRYFTFVEILVLIITGGGAFFLPALVRPIWPWEIAPFNLAFIGAIYLASLAEIAMMAVIARWSPARIVLWMLFTFTGIALIATLLNLHVLGMDTIFDWEWLVLYIALPLNSGFFLWLYRDQPPANPVAIPSGWRIFLVVQAVLLGIYGLGQFFLPELFSGFWPWKFDAFHSQLYSGTFLSSAVGSFVLSRAASRTEILALALPEIGLAILGIGGLVAVDLSVHRVDWAAAGTWAWIGMMAASGVTGIALLVWWRRARG